MQMCRSIAVSCSLILATLCLAACDKGARPREIAKQPIANEADRPRKIPQPPSITERSQIPVDNQQVAQDLAEKFSDAGFTDYDIAISFKNGSVELRGSVSNAEDAQRAVDVVESDSRVQRVENRLTIRHEKTVP